MRRKSVIRQLQHTFLWQMPRVGLAIWLLLSTVAASAQAIDYKRQAITLSLATEPPSLNSMISTDQISSFLLSHIMEGLVQYGATGELEPAVATHWEVREDGATFWLREDARWSDGKPVTAADFVYAWQRVVSPDTASAYAFILFPIRNAEAINRGDIPVSALGVEAPEPHRLEIRFARPCPYFAKLTAFMSYYPARQDVVERWGRAYAADADKMIFNGPFSLEKWVHGAHLKLVKNPGYWNAEAIRLNSIDMPYITSDTSTHYNLFKDGQIALAPLDSSTLQDATERSYDIHLFDFGSLYFLEFNFREGYPTANLALRRAIQLVLDPALLVYKVLGLPGVKPAYSLFPSVMRAGDSLFSDSYPPPRIQYNIEQARRYLAQAKQELGEIPVLTLLVGDSPRASNEAEFYQYVLKQSLGLKTRLDQQTFKQRIAKEKLGDFDIAAAGWGPDFDDPITFGDLFSSWNENNRGRFVSSDYDRWVKTAQLSSDPGTRLRAFDQMQKIIADQAVIIPTYENAGLYVQNPRLQGVRRSVFGGDPNYRYAWVE